MNKNIRTPTILKINNWDADLPIGNWRGPDPLPLFPSIKLITDQDEKKRRLRELHIQYNPDSNQHLKIVDWVNNNIPDTYKWLFHGLEIHYTQFQNIFIALPSVHILEEKENSTHRIAHPEIYKDDWDAKLDLYRAKFMKYLTEINCAYQFVSENEALDNGMLILKDYERPQIIGSIDTSPGLRNPPNKLWRFLTISKFVSLLQNQSIWFSRPQYFDDPHEFTIDEKSQQELFQWKLDSFAREYNRAVQAAKNHIY